MSVFITILFVVLKIIGILILSIILLTLLLAFLIMIAKLKYVAIADKKDTSNDFTLTKVSVRAFYFFKIFKINFSFKEQKLKYLVTAFGKKIVTGGSDVTEIEKIKKETLEKKKQEKKQQKIKRDELKETKSKNIKNKSSIKTKKTFKANKKNIVNNKSDTKKQEDKENIALVYLKDIKVMKRIFSSIKKMFKRIIPTKFTLKCELGLEDPSLTGQIVGLCWTVKGLTGLDINVDGNFEEQLITGNIYIKGEFSCWQLISPFIWIIFHEIKRRILKKFKHSNKK